MIRKNLIMHCSLFAGLVGALVDGDAFAAVRIGNSTRNYYNQQVAEQQRIAQFAPAINVAPKPTVTTDERTESSTNAAKLDACSRIYPNGEFDIAQPTAGIGAGGAKTCVAVVELRGYQMGNNGSDVVLARANVAAGSAVKCNISEFPEMFYTSDVGNVLFPADNEPTVQDVIKVMNQEQKQNAGLKIAAGALIGAVGGNLSGKNDVGKDGLFGTSKSQMTNTVIGAVGGAAIGAGGAYAGKVGGDMIMSTGINAAAGGVVGNIMAAGDSVLRIEKCKDKDGIEDSCLWGYLVTGPTLKQIDGLLCEDGKVDKCFKYFINLDDGTSVMRCNADNKECVMATNLVSIRVQSDKDASGEALESLQRQDLDRLKNSNSVMLVNGANNTKEMVASSGNAIDNTYQLIVSAKLDTGPKKPVLIRGFQDSAFGKRAKDWQTWKANHADAAIYYRNGDGSADSKNLRMLEDGKTPDQSVTLDNFYPMYIDAEDGGIVDLGNKARLKSTLIGAGAGGAIGAFTAYQGAQSDIDERWVSAVREYKDSLQKFYCVTGDRFLSYYNDTVLIPSINE